MTTGPSPASPFGENDLVSLGQKLATLDLTDSERAALSALLTDDDVVGFSEFNLIKGIRFGLRNNDIAGLRADHVGLRAGQYGVRASNLKSDGLGGQDPMKPGRF